MNEQELNELQERVDVWKEDVRKAEARIANNWLLHPKPQPTEDISFREVLGRINRDTGIDGLAGVYLLVQILNAHRVNVAGGVAPGMGDGVSGIIAGLMLELDSRYVTYDPTTKAQP